MTSTSFLIAHVCVLVAALLPIVCAGLAKRHGFGRSPREGGYDNVNPRAWLARQEGRSAWAHAAQANSFEALPFFIGAVVIAQQTGADAMTVNVLAVTFVTLRIAYIAAYLTGRASLRSVVWLAALGVNAALLFAGHF